MVNKKVLGYVEKEIIPRYQLLDKAHNEEHVRLVIDTSLKISKGIPVNIDMVYVIAAYHDLGLKVDRKTHHLESGRILIEDQFINGYFTSDQIEIMKEAIEDHRASGPTPRSIYGKIVSDADRDYNFKNVLIRCINYRINSQEDPEVMFDEVRSHIFNKYRTGGYLKEFYIREKDMDVQVLFDKFCEDEIFAREAFIKVYQEIVD